MGKQYEVYVQKGQPFYKILTNILFSHVGLLFLVLAYAFGGAVVFQKLEEQRELDNMIAKQDATNDVNLAVHYLKSAFWQYGTNVQKYNYSKADFKQSVKDDLVALRRYVLTKIDEDGYDATDEFTRDFTFESTVLFTITIMSTVGYGHISPGTDNGKLFCIFYSLIGIPLLLVFMTQIGDWMAVTFRWLYSRILCRWCRARRRDSELPPGIDRRAKGLAFDEVGKERYMPTDLVMVPITVNLILIFSFIFIGAIFFTVCEDWDPTASAYFCFITLTTIGFGDYYPQESMKDFLSDPVAFLKMSFVLAYCIFGMTLLSMCLNLMQEQIIEKVKWLAAELGMSGDGNDEEVVKLSREGRVTETPADKTGNDVSYGHKKKKKDKKKGDKDPEAATNEDIAAPPPQADEDAADIDFSDPPEEEEMIE